MPAQLEYRFQASLNPKPKTLDALDPKTGLY